MILSFCEAHKDCIKVSTDRRLITLTPLNCKTSEVSLPIECHYLHTSYYRIGPEAPHAYLDYIWESYNILFESFPGHIELFQQNLPVECLIQEGELLRR